MRPLRYATLHGPLAQLVEQGTLNPKVGGSIPPRPIPPHVAIDCGFRFGGRIAQALLRAARGTYGSAIREALAEAGCEDLPRNGSFVKQAVGQLVDTLVVRGYLAHTRATLAALIDL
jgi:hypothetical protein